jgi:hypothetical protein
LFGPLACVPGLLATPILLYLLTIQDEGVKRTYSGTSIGLLATITAILVLVIHYSNASMVHHYFSLVDNEQKLIFGDEVKTARRELFYSRGIERAYLTTLFVLCGVESST